MCVCVTLVFLIAVMNNLFSNPACRDLDLDENSRMKKKDINTPHTRLQCTEFRGDPEMSRCFSDSFRPEMTYFSKMSASLYSRKSQRRFQLCDNAVLNSFLPL